MAAYRIYERKKPRKCKHYKIMLVLQVQINILREKNERLKKQIKSLQSESESDSVINLSEIFRNCQIDTQKTTTTVSPHGAKTHL